MTIKDSGEAAFQAIVRELEELARQEVAVGILSGKGAEEERAPGINMATLGAIHEFGAPEANIPERSFLRHTADERKEEVVDIVQRTVGVLIDGNTTAEMVLNAAGAFLSSATKAYVMDPATPPPPLSEATIRRKGSSNPLVDTGRLAGSITHEVRPKS